MIFFRRSPLILLLLLAAEILCAQCISFKAVYGGPDCQNTFVLTSDNRLLATGRNYLGSLGNGTPSETAQYGLVELVPGTQWRSVAGSFPHTLAIQSNGTLWAWGSNQFGQLGNGTTTGGTSPVQVGTDTDWQSIATGSNHSLALKENGTLWAWGFNSDGQLGISSSGNRNTPVQVGTDTDWQSLTGFGNSSIALKKNGTLWAWGSNFYGQFGNGTTTSSYGPVKVGTATDWQMVAGGAIHCVAIKSDGTLWAWGNNQYGQLGQGTTTNSLVPVQIGTQANWRSISAGSNHALAIQSGGTLWSWGRNEYGQLGQGTTVNSLTPAQVGTATDWSSLITGFGHSLALKTGGQLMGWGMAASGRLGFQYSTGYVVKPYPVNIYNSGWPGSNAIGTVDYVINNLPYTFHLGCNPIATVTTSNYTAGDVSATVRVATSQPKGYVKRYYDIIPAVNPATTNGRVTLYFTNEEFKSFNEQVPAPALLLPDIDDAATVSARRANLRIEKRGSNGTIQTINPGASGVVHNATNGRWEVTFNVNGFSSFYAKTQTANLVLPVTFGQLTATLHDDELDVRWQTLSESNNDYFMVEASGDGELFKAIGQMPSLAKDGNADTTLNYKFRFQTHSNGVAAMLGAGLFTSLLIFFRRNRKWSVAAVFVGILGFMACQKDEVKNAGIGDNLFIRITQVDKDGTKTQSTVVRAVKY